MNLKFNIRDIGPDGLRVRRTIHEAQVHALLVDAGVSTQPSAAAAARLDLVLSRESDAQTVIARGSAEAEFQVACARCLGAATIHAEEPALKLTFLPASRRVVSADREEAERAGGARRARGAERATRAEEEDGRGLELALEDLDTYCHDGENVDLAPFLRELLLLAIPMAPLCSPSCKGLCPGCGADLNQASCACAAPTSTTSWSAALAELKKS